MIGKLLECKNGDSANHEVKFLNDLKKDEIIIDIRVFPKYEAL
jgi:hypothetical protein